MPCKLQVFMDVEWISCSREAIFSRPKLDLAGPTSSGSR